MRTKLFSLAALLFTVTTVIVQAQQFTNFTSDNGLPADNVNGVAVDAGNHKWFATSAGVAVYNDTTWKVYTTADGLIDNSVNCIAVDKDNHVWAGTDFGISKFDGSTWTSYTTASGLINSMVSYIGADPDGSVWIGTNGGLSHLSGSTWTSYTTTEGLPANMISYIRCDGSGNTWIGTWLGGLAKFNGTTFKTFSTADSLPDMNVLSIATGTGNTIWVATFSGVAVLGSDDKWTATYRQADGLLNNYVQDMALDSRGTMWFGIYDIYTQDGGITRKNQAVWKSYTKTDGLVNALVRRVAVDQHDYVWIATGSGVSKLDDPSAGIGEKSLLPIAVFPNPSSGEIHLDGMLSSGQLRIRSADGRLVLSREVSAGSNTISLQGLAAGIYFLTCSTSQGCSTGKLIVR